MKLLQLCKRPSEKWGVASGSCDLLSLFQVWLSGEVINEGDAIEKRIKK